MEFEKVTVSCRNIKIMAKQTLYGRWLRIAGVMLVLTLLQEIPAKLFSIVDADGGLGTYLIYALSILLMGMLSFAVAAYMLSVFRMDRRPVTRLMMPVMSRHLFFKTVGLFSLIALLTMVAGMLFVIPGIIVYYKYSQAFYILCDHPEYTPGQCMAASAAMMRGNKGQRFTLDLSFLGWYLLPLIPAVLAAIPLCREIWGVVFEYVRAMTAEQIEAIVADEAAYTGFLNTLIDLETKAAGEFMNAHPGYHSLEILASVAQVLLAAVAAAYTGCASACFYEFASGKLTLRGDRNRESDPFYTDTYEVEA